MKRIVWALLLAALLPLIAQRSMSQDLQGSSDPNQQRAALLARIAAKEEISKSVAEAFNAIPRERFLPSYLANMAYDDTSLPLGNGQTLPSPSDLLRAIQALDVQANDTVLVVGENTGYVAALLSRLARRVYDVEQVSANRTPIRQLFATLGLTNITVAPGAAADSFVSSAPFARIFIHGAAREVPTTVIDQLSATGKIVVPLRDPTGFQMVVLLSQAANGLTVRALGKGFFSPIQIGVAK